MIRKAIEIFENSTNELFSKEMRSFFLNRVREIDFLEFNIDLKTLDIPIEYDAYAFLNQWLYTHPQSKLIKDNKVEIPIEAFEKLFNENEFLVKFSYVIGSEHHEDLAFFVVEKHKTPTITAYGNFDRILWHFEHSPIEFSGLISLEFELSVKEFKDNEIASQIREDHKKKYLNFCKKRNYDSYDFRNSATYDFGGKFESINVELKNANIFHHFQEAFITSKNNAKLRFSSNRFLKNKPSYKFSLLFDGLYKFHYFNFNRIL